MMPVGSLYQLVSVYWTVFIPKKWLVLFQAVFCNVIVQKFSADQ